MKTLSYVILALALTALVVTPVAASPVPLLRADLDGDKDVEVVMPMIGLYPSARQPIFTVADTDKDGDVDEIETRGTPTLLANLDNDAMYEAVIRDRALGSAWGAYALGSNDDRPALVFVRGRIDGFAPTPGSDKQVLLVSDPAYTGTADIDGDGSVDIRWTAQPSLMSASPSDR